MKKHRIVHTTTSAHTLLFEMFTVKETFSGLSVQKESML